MLRAGFLALAAAVMAATAHASVSVTIKNSCSESISLYDNSATTTMAAGASTTRTLANSYVGMFRNGADDEATLAEFSVDSDGTPWYDISIIPPGSTTCTSLSACQSETGVTGFNTAVQIAPQSNTDSTNCETVTCMADGCDDAYQYPTDDDNTHTCPVGTSFVVTFCPGGSGSSSSTTSTPTPTPTSTTATPTPTPTSTTATPTPTPTASASSSGSDSDDSGSSEVAGEAYDGSFSLSNSTSTTKSSASKDTDTGSAGVTEAADTDSATTAATSGDATAAATTDASGSDDGAVEISTQSSGGGGSTFGIVFASGIAVVGIAAGGFIYAVRQKKKQLDNETKSPGPETSREVSVLMATPGVVL